MPFCVRTVFPLFYSSMVRIPCDKAVQFPAELLKIKRSFFRQSRLVSLQTNHIVRLTGLDFSDDALLITHGVCGHDTSRRIQCIQRFWRCCDFIGLSRCCQFSRHDLAFLCKRAHNMICLAASALAVTYGFSIYGCCRALFPVTAQPVIQALCQRFQVYSFKYPPKCGTVRYSMRQLRELVQPFRSWLPECLHIREVFRTAQ